jgi:pyruvate/2-oxoglutarate dehydrogenase complex dihydrolipoamide acyltransferase (E2) component
MVSNLGSLGLDGALHHLYEQGTCSINATLGRVRREVVVRDDGRIETPLVAPMTFAIDERVADGFYFARSVDLLATYLQDPDRLRFQR